ncbi:hypothetical protein DL768_010226 [Monosporascus sp. mg162]|nr:hypothetical protein DL768_010226 [Monosporascus sp. mg162]
MDKSSAVSPITTYGGWAVIILVGFVAYQKYFAKRNTRALLKQPGRQQRSADAASFASDAKKKAEKAVKQKPKPKTPSVAPKEETPSTLNYEKWEDDAAAERKADREFARQLSNTHSGTKFNTKKSEEKRAKSVKQSKAEEGLNVPAEKPSAPSSHAGDADDDLSPPTSPAAAAVNGQDVSDMLETSAPGPSVLRLTDTDSVKPKERKKTQAPEVVETKKQRQNRKKAEAAKAIREEQEKERKVLMEQQRRTARIAEGRAAKDGSTFTASQKNAWNEKPTADDTVQPLDTFEQQPKPKAEPTKPAAPVTATNKKQENADPWLSGVPSEEEQMEMLRQEESWSEVKTKKKGKKKDAAPESSATPVALADGTDGTSATTASKPVAAPAATKRPIIASSSSSFAALTPDETDDNDDDVEKEWDV